MYDQIGLEMELVERPFEEKKRRLAFSGTKNFRDLGGYRTTDDRVVRWGRLYRSGHLQKLTDADLGHLADLGLDKIIDFRVKYEKEKEPDRLPADMEIRIVELPIMDSTTELWKDLHDQLIKDDLDNIDPAQFLVKTNNELVTRFRPEISRFVQELLSSKGRPVLFHCAAGKDRTGYTAALILRILGIPLEEVMDDYLLSNQYYLPTYSWYLIALQMMKGKRVSDVVEGFLEVRPAYLSAAFNAIDLEFGSFENYVSSGLGLTIQDVDLLRNLYLE